MKKIIIVGGNSGIGLESAHQLTTIGHHVILMGRSKQKGEAALERLKTNSGKSEFIQVDISTHEGVRAAASKLLSAHKEFDILLHTSGVLIMNDMRTTDGLHPLFSVNYLSRYHLTQLLLPVLQRSAFGRVIMLTSKFPLDTRIDFNMFPTFSPYNFRQMTAQIQIGNQHYAAHLRDSKSGILAATVNAGVVKTAIWRKTPWYVKIFTTILSPFMFNSVAQSAEIPVWLCTNNHWKSGSHWGKPGREKAVSLLKMDTQQTKQVISISHSLTEA